ncbi:peptidoglycan -binding protein [Dokdonella sp.]|uniref:peptidoglycan -binding protein n=1 Tax=Dokdonella sp. TaxID=2291710 RepID=UPI0031C0DEB4|nr:peptidoglycan -binding protein [Dokdonella sp.]
MSALRRRRAAFDIWPGFVDALTSLIMVMIFVLLIFAIGQFVLSDTLSGKNRALDALNARVAELAHTLSLSEAQNKTLDARVAELAASLGEASSARDAASQEAARLGTDVAALSTLKQQLEAEIARMAAELDTSHAALVRQTDLNASQAAQVELLNRQLVALNEQLARIQQALDLADTEARAKDAQIADLGRQLNVALAKRVSELERYRSEFFGRLRAALGERSDLRIVGDRFVLPTDILFPSASAELDPAAQQSLEVLATTVREIAADIPSSIDWVLRIDGHTDRRPIHTAQFPSNWELSTARALAIVKYLVVQGIPANRLSANGFGEFQPLDEAGTPDAWARNRRIEIQLTNR